MATLKMTGAFGVISNISKGNDAVSNMPLNNSFPYYKLPNVLNLDFSIYLRTDLVSDTI